MNRILYTLLSCLLTYTQPSISATISKRFGQGGDIIRGVNLGGLFVLEQWIKPSLFKQWDGPNPQAVDEWTYCAVLGKQECQRRLKQHWGSWVTETDIRTLSSLGLNHIRIPIGYWAFTVEDNEPYVQGQIPYLKTILGWIRKHKMNAILDLHGVPGSQNGFDNSGRKGAIEWQQTQQNIDRSIQAVEAMANLALEFSDVVDIVEIVNEPASWGLSVDGIIDYNKRAYETIRRISPDLIMMIHDAFLPYNEWDRFRIEGRQNVMIDTHNYYVFDESRKSLDHNGLLRATCDSARQSFGYNTKLWTVTGEWSLAVVNMPGSIGQWSSDDRVFMRQFAEAQMDAYEAGSGWLFWNFKMEDSDMWDYIKLAKNGIVPNPPTDRHYSRYSLDSPHWDIKINSPWCN